MKAEDGMLQSKVKGKLTRWAKHFPQVLNIPHQASPYQTEDSSHMLPIVMDTFSVDKTRRAIKSCKNIKSPEFNGITVEMLKAREDCIIPWMSSFCNQVWNSGIVPKDWKMEKWCIF